MWHHRQRYTGRLRAVSGFLRTLSDLATALYIWSVVARVSTTNMRLLYHILHSEAPDAAAMAAALPKDFNATKDAMDKARKIYRVSERAFEEIGVEIREDPLVSRLITSMTGVRSPDP